MRNDDDALSPELTTAARVLRADVAVRPEWRAALLERVAEGAVEERRDARRVSMSIPLAIAAGVVCAVAGAATAIVATRAKAPPTVAVAKAPTETSATMLPVRFSVVAPSAARVSIVGDFNNWNPTALPMRRSADGRLWEIEVRLPLGRYTYAFMIDGRLAPDPGAPRAANDDFGAPNSVLMVRGS